jgi:hypothetical protein
MRVFQKLVPEFATFGNLTNFEVIQNCPFGQMGPNLAYFTELFALPFSTYMHHAGSQS